MKNKFRHANIAIAVCMALLVVDFILFRDNEEAMTAGAGVAFLICFAVNFFLDEREYRARHPRDHGSS
jgi:hypothetical protein